MEGWNDGLIKINRSGFLFFFPLFQIPIFHHSITKEVLMGLFEDYHPLKGEMFQILRPDGSLQPGEKSPLSDQETFNLYPTGGSEGVNASEAGSDGNLCAHLGPGGLSGRECIHAQKGGLGLSRL
jgi:hypothetical protein